MDYEDRLSIATPEGLELELVLAGARSRFIAGLLDLGVRLVVLDLVAGTVVVRDRRYLPAGRGQVGAVAAKSRP